MKQAEAHRQWRKVSIENWIYVAVAVVVHLINYNSIIWYISDGITEERKGKDVVIVVLVEYEVTVVIVVLVVIVVFYDCSNCGNCSNCSSCSNCSYYSHCRSL